MKACLFAEIDKASNSTSSYKLFKIEVCAAIVILVIPEMMTL